MEFPLDLSTIKSFLDVNNFSYVYRGKETVSINGFSDPSEYRSSTAIWLGDDKHLKLKSTQSKTDVALLFAPSEFAAEGFPSVFYCQDPRNAFMSLVEAMAPQEHVIGISKLAQISPSATIGKNVFIGPGVVVEDNTEIGDDTQVQANSVIRAGTRIGKNCLIMSGCVIGNSGYGFRRLPDDSFSRLPHLGGVLIGDNVEIGSNSVIDKGTFKDTLIEMGTKIDSLALIGHNTHIGKNCLIIGGTIGGNCVIGEMSELVHVECKNRITIGNNVKAGIGSVIIRDLPSDAQCFGNPARIIGKRDA